MPPMGSARPASWAALAACVAVAFGLWQAWQITTAPFPSRYDYDEGVYAETAAAAARGARLYADVFLSQPPALIAAVRAAYRLGGETLAAARAVPLLASLLWLTALFAILAAAGRPRAGVLAACAAAGNTAFATGAHTVQMDVPSEALAAAAVAAALVACRGRTVFWVLAGAALGLAALTKFTALVTVVPVACLAAAGHAAAAGPARAPRAPWITAAALALGAAAAALPFLPAIASPRFIADTVRFHLDAARAIGSAPLPHLIAVSRFLAASWPLTAAAALGVWTARGGAAPGPDRVPPRPIWAWWIPITWLLAETAALAAITPLWPHHLVLLLSPLALLAGTGTDAAITAASRSTRTVPAAVALLCVAAYLAAGVPDGLQPDHSAALRRAADVLARRVSPRGDVLTDDPLVPFLAGRRVPPELIDTSAARIAARALEEERLDAALSDSDVQAVLLWRGTFARAFPGFVERATVAFPIAALADGDRRLLLKRLRRDRAPLP